MRPDSTPSGLAPVAAALLRRRSHAGRRSSLVAQLLVAVAVPAAPALAQETPVVPATSPPGETGAASPAVEVEEAPGPRSEEGDRQAKLEWKGRVFGRAAYEDVRAAGGLTDLRTRQVRLSVPSVRLGAKYEVTSWLSLVAEADFTDTPLLRDGFVAARSRHLRGRAGQFKMPASSINLESPWNLPTARRGIIQGILHDHMLVLGRRPGFMGSVRGGGSLDPELAIGAFHGALLDAQGKFELLEGQIDAQNLTARFSVTPAGQELALTGQRISTLTPTAQGFTTRPFWAAGIDATLDEPFSVPGLRGWLEGFLGRTYFRTFDEGGIATGAAESTFAAARGIVAWRWRGAERGAGYLEPFVLCGILDARTEVASDEVWELLVGLNLGFWRDSRLTLQAELGGSGHNVPLGLFSDPTIRRIKDHKALVVQLGAAF